MSESDANVLTLDGTLARLLTDRGPLSVAELTDAVGESGIDLGSDAEEELLTELYESAGDGFARLADDRWVYVPALVGGRVVTHRLTQPEIVHDALATIPDLALILALPDNSDQLELGGG